MIKSQPSRLKKEEEFIPHECKCGIICLIHKKGDVMMCDNYGADPLLCTTYKILANILYVKLVLYSEEIMENTKEAFKGEGQLLIKSLL